VRFVDAEGNEVTKEQYIDLFHDQGYRQLMRTTIHKRWFVVTTWVGIDLAIRGRSLYFETVVQDLNDPEQLVSVAKYPTKSSALVGHRYMVKQIRDGRLRPFAR
jgi:hypothetical protein